MQKVIEVLKQAANKSQAIHDMFLDFGTRERARGQVTLRSFYNRMNKNGFKHSSYQYADGLKVLAECGFGEIRYSRNNGVIGLFDIKTTLSSIGEAVLGKVKDLQPRTQRAKYIPLAIPELPEPTITKKKETPIKDVKQEVFKALESVDSLIQSILENASIPAENRIEAARALMQVNIQ
jgi:hypothetical protein